MTQKSKVKNSDKNQQMLIIGGIVAVVVILFGAVLFLANPSGKTLDYNNTYAERTDDGAFILGNPEAPITVVAWEDFLCPHCQNYQPTIKRFIEDYVLTGQARFEFRMLPISNQSGFIFSLVECAAVVEDDPSAFWPAHDAMFNLASTNGANLDGGDFADEIGVSYGAMLDCASEVNQYETDRQLAGQFGDAISGTPAVAWRLNNGDIRLDIINRQPTYEDLAGLVEVFGR